MSEVILRERQQPEYLHVLPNPLPLYGLAIAVFGLVARRKRLRNRVR